MKRDVLAKMLGELYKLVKIIEEPVEEVKRQALEPVENVYRDVLLSSLYRLTKPKEPSLDELKERVKEALGVDLEEFLVQYREKVKESSEKNSGLG